MIVKLQGVPWPCHFAATEYVVLVLDFFFFQITCRLLYQWLVSQLSYTIFDINFRVYYTICSSCFLYIQVQNMFYIVIFIILLYFSC